MVHRPDWKGSHPHLELGTTKRTMMMQPSDFQCRWSLTTQGFVSRRVDPHIFGFHEQGRRRREASKVSDDVKRQQQRPTAHMRTRLSNNAGAHGKEEPSCLETSDNENSRDIPEI
ncbi:hypothetical protein B9Z55_006337 [Caenorhabditis nigoni]|uniref:Uncharacterized protein n=1 Tax=Caenorhabditis nigoni TaxID=1611254 RepID=A0A2G5V4M5_9PELO|nr:hypothetical protein B9Z55_006337 [Caenorhabditis nigoni]